MLPRNIAFLFATTTALVLSGSSCSAFAPSVSSPRTFGSLLSTPDNAEGASAAAGASDASPAAAAASAEPVVHGVGVTYARCGKCDAIYYLEDDELGNGRGRRLSCSICEHSWFQSKGRLLSVKEGFEMVPLPENDLERINLNIAEGKAPKFLGDCKLYVGNIAFDCHEDDILELFAQVGTVGDVSLVRDEFGKNRGFGFVTMRNQNEAEKAIAKLDGQAVRGRNIAVRESNN